MVSIGLEVVILPFYITFNVIKISNKDTCNHNNDRFVMKGFFCANVLEYFFFGLKKKQGKPRGEANKQMLLFFNSSLP